MNYDLALKLKEAGFPQYKAYTLELAEKNGGTNPDYLKTPTLEELIDACGDGFDELNHPHKMLPWIAIGGHEYGFGETPTEAVANLYRALHPNNKD